MRTRSRLAQCGRVLQKTGLTPCWCSGYGQNPGPDKDGWCSWEMDVIRRDGNLFLGLLVPSVVEGELDRQWNSKCFRDLSWYWATTAGTLMCGDQITKTLPTNKVPVFHANAGYVPHDRAHPSLVRELVGAFRGARSNLCATSPLVAFTRTTVYESRRMIVWCGLGFDHLCRCQCCL